MVLFVPKGVDPEEDPTRDAKYYDDSSIRTIFLPKTVAEMLVEFKAE